jgi:hypothetical protein
MRVLFNMHPLGGLASQSRIAGVDRQGLPITAGCPPTGEARCKQPHLGMRADRPFALRAPP